MNNESLRRAINQHINRLRVIVTEQSQVDADQTVEWLPAGIQEKKTLVKSASLSSAASGVDQQCLW